LNGNQPDARPLPTHRTTQHIKTWTHIHVSRGIRTHDPSVLAAEDRTCLSPLGHQDRKMRFFAHNTMSCVCVCFGWLVRTVRITSQSFFLPDFISDTVSPALQQTVCLSRHKIATSDTSLCSFPLFTRKKVSTTVYLLHCEVCNKTSTVLTGLGIKERLVLVLHI